MIVSPTNILIWNGRTAVRQEKRLQARMSFAKAPQAAETYEIKTEAPQAAEQKMEYKSFFF